MVNTSPARSTLLISLLESNSKNLSVFFISLKKNEKDWFSVLSSLPANPCETFSAEVCVSVPLSSEYLFIIDSSPAEDDLTLDTPFSSNKVKLAATCPTVTTTKGLSLSN